MDEQLEQLKIDYKNGFPINIEWLIQQAEKVPELEEVIHLYKLRKENAQELNEIVIKPLKDENQRYKEALEEIQEYVDSTSFSKNFLDVLVINKIISKALKGESE